MKYKAVLEEKIDSAKILVESMIKGIDSNTISKEEIRNKLRQVLINIEQVGNTISIESNDY